MRAAVSTIRRLLRGETVEVGEGLSRLRNVSSRPTPVYMLAAGPRMVELAGEVADGVVVMAGLHPEAIAAVHRHLAAGACRAGRSLEGFPMVFIVTIALGPSREAARRWIKGWFAPGHPFLTYPNASNLYWLGQAGLTLPDPLVPEAIPDDLAARTADAFGLFGPPEYCLERLLRARDEAAVERVFLFPAHTLEGGYEMPAAEVDAFARILRPGLPA
jgi:5,10-methylenetetrahydromethanopterin reductase